MVITQVVESSHLQTNRDCRASFITVFFYISVKPSLNESLSN